MIMTDPTRDDVQRITASASLMSFLRVASSLRSSGGAEITSRSWRFPMRSYTWIPVVPASPSMNIFGFAVRYESLSKRPSGTKAVERLQKEIKDVNLSILLQNMSRLCTFEHFRWVAKGSLEAGEISRKERGARASSDLRQSGDVNFSLLPYLRD